MESIATVELSKEEKEKKISDKIKSIRKKNDELRKRHEEIEDDKRLADEHSAGVQMEEVKLYIMKPPRLKPEKILNISVDESESNPSVETTSPRQRLNQEDGPPPDPSYRFLADPDRDRSELKKNKNLDNKQLPEDDKQGRSRRGRGRSSNDRESGWARGRVSKDGCEGGHQTNLRHGKVGERAYEQWKAERNAIDEARISRARSGDGEWKREWDMAKIDQEDVVTTESEYDYTFNQRKRGDSFKLKELLTDEVKTKLENKPRRGGRQTIKTRQGRRGTLGTRESNDQQHENNWREKIDNDLSDVSYFQNRQDKHRKIKQTVTTKDTKVVIESNTVLENIGDSINQ